jgi:hypothetical protein
VGQVGVDHGRETFPRSSSNRELKSKRKKKNEQRTGFEPVTIRVLNRLSVSKTKVMPLHHRIAKNGFFDIQRARVYFDRRCNSRPEHRKTEPVIKKSVDHKRTIHISIKKKVSLTFHLKSSRTTGFSGGAL